ncbi:MAG: transposase, partial [Haloarculaceae archaeon]
MSCSNSSTADDTPALAGAIVEHAGAVCEHTDHLRHVLGDVSIPVDGLTDHRQQHKVSYGTEPMARLYIYQQIHDLTQPEVVGRLENRPSELKTLGLDTVPDQQVISYAWQQFSHQTEQILIASATGIALEARDSGVILEQRLPILPDEGDIEKDEDGDPQATRDYVSERGGNLVKLARRHGFGEFNSNRASNR